METATVQAESRGGLRARLAMLVAVAGPAAVMAAGIMGAGSTTALVLAGAWFRYDLLWVAVYTLPAVIVCLDSGARVGVVSGHKGMLSLIREEIHPVITWFVLLVMVLFNIFVNMGQMSVMTASFLSLFGWNREMAPTGTFWDFRTAEFACSALFALGILALLWSGGYRRVRSAMTILLLVMLACFLLVALRGFQELPAILAGLVPRVPADVPVPGTDKTRLAYDSVVAIAGGALAAAPILSFSYFTSDDNARPENLPRYFWKTVLNLGVIFGLYSVLVLVAGGFALYPLEGSAQIDKVHEAGRVLTHALPASLGALGPKVFAIGLFCCALTTLVVVAQLMCYFMLDAFGQDWRNTDGNKAFRWLLVFWVAVPAMLAPLWEFPALLKMVLLMGINIVLVPMAIVIVWYLINKRSLMGEYRASVGRNVFLAASLGLALWLAWSKLPGYWTQIRTLIMG